MSIFGAYEPPQPIREIGPNGQLHYIHGELAITELPAELPRYSIISGCVIHGSATIKIMKGSEFRSNLVGVGMPAEGSPTLTVPPDTSVNGCEFQGPVVVVDDSGPGNLYWASRENPGLSGTKKENQ